MAAYAAPDGLLEAFRAAAREAIDAGATVIVPGEGPLNVFLADHGVSRVDDVPVLDSLGTLLQVAEMRARQYRRSGLCRPGRASTTSSRRAPWSMPRAGATASPARSTPARPEAPAGAGASGERSGQPPEHRAEREAGATGVTAPEEPAEHLAADEQARDGAPPSSSTRPAVSDFSPPKVNVMPQVTG